MLTPQELQHLGQRTAVSLIKEMRFLGKLKNDSNLNDLLDIPSRDELGFQVVKGMDAAKSESSKGNFGAELAGLRFCVADGEVERVNIMDIDHTVPFKYIYTKQEALLDYLNDPNNTDFTEGFLKATATIDSKTINISDYFGRNPLNNAVQGTRRFFRLCYNDIDNLLLICHACNIQKGASDSLEWFRKQEPFLGERFVKAVNEAGGLYDGIVVKKICKATSDPGYIVKIGEFDCRLHDGEGKGLGEFVNDWFENENPGYSKGVVSAYSNIWLQLKEIWELQLKAKAADDKAGKEAKLAANKLTDMLDAQIKAVERHYGFLTKRREEDQSGSQDSSKKSHSTADALEDRKERIKLIDEDTKKLLKYIHAVKKIHSWIGSRDPALAATLNRDQLYEFLETLNIRGHDLRAQKNIFEKIYSQLTEQYATQLQKNPTIDEIKAIIKQVVLEENPLYGQLIAEQKGREEERKGRLAAEERAVAAEAKLADTHKWVGSHLAVHGSAADISDPSGQTMGSSILHRFDNPLYKQAAAENRKNSTSEERSIFQEEESSRSSSSEAPPSKKRSTTPPNRRSPSPY